MAAKIEGQNAAHVDVLVADRREPPRHLVGMIAWRRVDHCLDAVRIPRHDDVRQQGQGAQMVPGSSIVRPCFAVIMRLWMARCRLCTASPWLRRSRTPRRNRGSRDSRRDTGSEGAAWIPQSGRLPHVYVFAYHPIRDDSADHREPSQWQFYVVPTKQLPATKRIGLVRVASLIPAVSWPHLAAAVEQARRAL